MPLSKGKPGLLLRKSVLFLEAKIGVSNLSYFLSMLLLHLRKHLIYFRIFVLKICDSAGYLARFMPQAHSAFKLYKGRLKT